MAFDREGYGEYVSELNRQKNEQAEAQSQQTESETPWYEPAVEAAEGAAEYLAKTFVATPEKIENGINEVRSIGGDIINAAREAPDAYTRLWDNAANLQQQYSMENVQQANETGDYSAQQAAVEDTQEAGHDLTAAIALTPTRTVRMGMGSYINDVAEHGSDTAESMRDTTTFIDYFMTPEDKVAKAQEIENNLGISASAILDDDEAYKRALRMNDYYVKQKNVMDNGFSAMEQVWKKYPELNDLHNMNPQEQALALHNMESVRSTHDIIETFTKMLEVGNKRLELSNLGYKLAMGRADDNDIQRIKDLQAQVDYESQLMPSFWESPVSAIAGGLASSAPELWQSFTEGARDASVMASAAMIAGAAAGSAATPAGTAAGAAIGGLGGAVTGFGRSILLSSSKRAIAQAALSAGMRSGMWAGMVKPEIGERYLEYKDMKDENGNPLLTDDQARGYAALGGALNATIEMLDYGMISKALKGAPHASQVFGDIIAATGAKLTARETAKDILRSRLLDATKVTLAESGEEALQGASDDLIHNAIESSTGDTSNGVYSATDILGRAAMSFAESIPTSFGFGIISGAGGGVTGTIRATRAMQHQAKLEAKYGVDVNKTINGTLMLEQLQQAVASGKMKEKAPEVQTKVLRNQLAGTGYEMAYIDTETALEKETGAEDLKKVAQAADLSDEELNTAVQEKGQIAVPVEQLSQISTPDMMDSVSFSPEADSIARMRKDAKATLDEVKKRSEESAGNLIKQMDNIVDEYYPEYNEKGESNQQRRDLMKAAMYTDISNPSAGWTKLHDELRQELDEMIAPALERLKEGMGKGGQILEQEDELGHKKYVRASENDKWYQDFYKTYGRQPTKQELEDMAIAMLGGEASAPQVEGWIPSTAEEANAMREAGAQALELQNQLKTMEEIKPVMRRLNGTEMMLTKNLTPEGLKVYRTVSDQLTRLAPPNAARAARMDAILFARHADIVADIISKKTGKKYTALDYMRERYGLSTKEEYQQDGNQQVNSQTIYAEPKRFHAASGEMALKSVMSWFEQNYPEGVKANTIIGDVHISKSGIKDSLSHGFSQKKLDAIPTLKAGLERAKLMRTMPDYDSSKRFTYYYFVYPIMLGDEENFVLCRVKDDGHRKKLYIHEVATQEEIRKTSDTLHAGIGDHNGREYTRGIALYNSILADYLKKYKSDFHLNQMAGEHALTANQHSLIKAHMEASDVSDGKLRMAEKAWGQKVDDFIAGELKTNIQPVIMDAPMVLSLVGAKFGVPLKVKQSTMRKILKDVESADTHGHGGEISIDMFKKLPSLLSNPIMVLRSRSNRNGENAIIPKGYTFVVEATDRENRTIIIPVLLEADENSYTLKTFYGKKNIGRWLEERVSKGDVLYVNTEKNPQLWEDTHLAPMARRPSLAGDSLSYILQHSTREIKTEKDLAKLKNENPSLYQTVWHGSPYDFEYNQKKNSGVGTEQGRITKLSNGQMIINLFERADESTFAHEMAHMFLYDLEDLARIDEISAMELGVVNEWAEYKKGAEDEYLKTPWAKEFIDRARRIDAAEQAGDIAGAERLKAEWRQERFARAFEMYLRSGEAPAKGLKAVFRKFKQFLRTIYLAFVGDGGQPSVEVKRVMDRMIATEDEINEMALDDRYKDIEKAGGEKLLNENEREIYERWQKEAEEDSKERLMKIVMKDLEEKRQKAFEQDVERYREEQRRILQQNPIYLAEEAIRQSGGDEELALNWFESVEAYKKAREAVGPLDGQLKVLVDDYIDAKDEELRESHITDDEVTKAMDAPEYRKKLEAMKAAALARKSALANMITAKAQAAMRSVEEKIKAMPDNIDIQANKEDAHVKEVLDAINRLRFSKRWSKEDYQYILRLINAKSKADMDETLKKFKKSNRERKMNEKLVMDAMNGKMRAYEEAAHAQILNMPLAEAMNVTGFIKEAKRHARNVQRLIHEEKWDMAVAEQQQAAMASAMVHESSKLREKVQKDMRKIMQHLNAKSVHLSKDERYWLHHLAYILRLVPKDVERPESGVASLNDVFRSLTESLDIQFTPVDILEIASRGEDFRGWQSLNFDQWQDAMEALNILYTTGRDKKAMKTIGGKDVNDIIDEIINDDSAYDVKTQSKCVNEDRGGVGYNDWIAKAPGVGEKVAEKGQEYIAISLKPEEILRMLGKKAHDYIYGIYERAQEGESKRIGEELEALKKMLKPFSHKERQAWTKKQWTIYTADGPEKLSKENVICMALNFGNETNMQRLLGGLGIDNAEAVQQFVEEHMTKKDWELVQNIWDHLNSYWKETVAVEEKLNGVTLHKAEARAFTVTLPNGEEMKMRGGYYPIKYNPKKSSKSAENETNNLARQGMSGAIVLGTGRGFTKARSEADIERPLLLEFSVIPEHIQQVIHNIYFRIPARDVYRLVNSKTFEEHVSQTIGRRYHGLLKEWATDVWGQIDNNNNKAQSMIDRMIGNLRRNSVMAIMGYRSWPAIENISNIGPVMDKLGAPQTMAAISDFYAHIDASKELLYKSVFMRDRINSLDRDIRSQPGLFQADARPFEIIREHAYDMMLYSDLMLSAPLWVRTYKNAYADKLKEVTLENEANSKEAVDAQRELDEINGRIYDLNKNINDIEQEFGRRARREPGDANSPFTVRSRDDLWTEKQDNRAELKDLRQKQLEAEKRANKAANLTILSDEQILKEAERRAISEADGAIRDTFGSGRTMDLSSLQRNKNQLAKLMTTFYSFFNTQFNALYAQYAKAKFGSKDLNTIQRWAPFARSVMYRIVVMSLIGSALKYALGQDGDSDDQKYKKVKDENGKTIKQERSGLERFLNVFGKNLLSTTTGGFVGLRDIANMICNYAFDGTTYGRSFNPFSAGFRAADEAWKTYTLIAEKGEKDLEIAERNARKEQEVQERLKKLKGKKRQEYLQKLKEDKKYEKPDKRITYAEIARHGVNGVATLTAAHTGITSTLADAVTGTMQYMLDDDNRYDKAWTNVIWSALFDKKPVEREVPERPAAPPKKKKGKNNQRQAQ